MILGQLLSAFIDLFQWLISLMPSMPTEAFQWTAIFNMLGMLNRVIDLTVVFGALLLVFNLAQSALIAKLTSSIALKVATR